MLLWIEIWKFLLLAGGILHLFAENEVVIDYSSNNW